METIGAIIQANKKRMITQCSNTSLTVSDSRKAWLTKIQSHSDVDRIYSPSNWGYVMNNTEKAYTADCPTMYDIFDKFGEDYAELWIMGQVLALYGSSSNREKGVADGLKIFAQSFSSQVKAYKLSELMLFFARYKAGRYDNSFASFDARRIGNAFFKEFKPERNYELDTINRKRVQDEIENRRFIPPEGYSSLAWYNELKRRAESGDEEAKKMLMPP